MTLSGDTPFPTDDDLRRILRESRCIAVVGATADPAKPSHYVPRFLVERGYRVIPVNAALAGQEIFGERVRESLADIAPEENVDMIDIFRRSEQIPPVVDEALAALPGLRTVWMQVGIANEAAAAAARARGIEVVQSRCPKMDYPRLFGDAKLSEITGTA